MFALARNVITFSNRGVVSSAPRIGIFASSSANLNLAYFASSTKNIKKTVNIKPSAKSSTSKSSPKTTAKSVPAKSTSATPAKSKTAAATATKTVAKGNTTAKAPIKKTIVKTSQKITEATKKASQRTAALKKKVENPEKLKLRNERAKERMLKEKEREKQAKEREREKAQKLKEREKQQSLIEKEKEKKRLAREAKANRIKRPISSYNIFTKNTIPLLRKSNPNASIPEIMKLAAAKWSGMNESEKKPFAAEAAKDKKRYEGLKKEEEKNAPPKRPFTSFLIFANEIRPQLLKNRPGLKVAELGKEIGARWRKLSQAEQEKYKQRHVKLVAEHNKKYGIKAETE